MLQRFFFPLPLWLVILIFTTLLPQSLPAQSPVPFWPEGQYDSAVPTPDQVLGFPLGQRPARYDEAVRYLKTLASVSPRVHLLESGKTHEGRILYYALVSDEQHLANQEQIKADLAKLGDPRLTGRSAASGIIDNSPAVAWMMYSIHGDELSGADASLQLAYQLAAGNDEVTQRIRSQVLVGIDPMENPDGRERYLGQMQQWNGRIPNSDTQSMQHTSVWPWGRTNHYLFDLNRDWFILSQPESRARVKAINEWNPQLIVDAHEMGSFSSFLFPPAREPVNPNFHPRLQTWVETFAANHARAFDRYGWSYYTGEWLEDWYPGYGSSMPFLRGAIGILYEQASTDGTLIKRPDGTELTYREAVHHQFISSMADLGSLAENRQALLEAFYDVRAEAVANNDGPAAYYIVPGENPTRAYRLAERLIWQGIEVEIAEREFQPGGLRSYLEKTPTNGKSLPRGTLIVKLNQPLRPLIKAILEFDPRMTRQFLVDERESLEKGEGTRLYEVSSWSMLMAYHLTAYRAQSHPNVKSTPLTVLPGLDGQVLNRDPAYGYLIEYEDDQAVPALFALLNDGYKVRAAQKAFRVENRDYRPGTLLLRNIENPADLPEAVQRVSDATGVTVRGVNTALSQSGADVGGDEFRLLVAPRIAMLAGSSVSTYNTGAMWYLLDHELGERFSMLNINRFSRFDLRKYNVLIMPSSSSYKEILGKRGIQKISDWVSDGGTLIAIGNAAAFLADSSNSLSRVKLRRQALGRLADYRAAVDREKQIGKSVIDSVAIWENGSMAAEEESMNGAEKISSEEDSRLRRFMPRGAILQVDLDPEHWLSFGAGETVPAIIYSSYAYLAKSPVETAGRLAVEKELRLSGLLWPEARERWAETAYLTRESKGHGQVILFAGEANFRSYFYGTGRLLINSFLLGPGFGTRQPVQW